MPLLRLFSHYFPPFSWEISICHRQERKNERRDREKRERGAINAASFVPDRRKRLSVERGKVSAPSSLLIPRGFRSFVMGETGGGSRRRRSKRANVSSLPKVHPSLPFSHKGGARDNNGLIHPSSSFLGIEANSNVHSRLGLIISRFSKRLTHSPPVSSPSYYDLLCPALPLAPLSLSFPPSFHEIYSPPLPLPLGTPLRRGRDQDLTLPPFPSSFSPLFSFPSDFLAPGPFVISLTNLTPFIRDGPRRKEEEQAWLGAQMSLSPPRLFSQPSPISSPSAAAEAAQKS